MCVSMWLSVGRSNSHLRRSLFLGAVFVSNSHLCRVDYLLRFKARNGSRRVRRLYVVTIKGMDWETAMSAINKRIPFFRRRQNEKLAYYKCFAADAARSIKRSQDLGSGCQVSTGRTCTATAPGTRLCSTCYTHKLTD